METEISRWFGLEYRVYTEDRNLYERLIRRKGCWHSARYYYPDGTRAWDVIVSEEQIDAVRELLKTQARQPRRGTKPGLNDNGLRNPKSSQSASKCK